MLDLYPVWSRNKQQCPLGEEHAAIGLACYAESKSSLQDYGDGGTGGKRSPKGCCRDVF